MDIKKIIRQLQEEFAIKKIKVETEASKNRERAYSNKNFVKLSALEKEIEFMLASEKVKPTLDKKIIKSLGSDLEKTREEKVKLLGKMGLKLSDLEPKYECPVCKDSGFIGTEPCTCFIKRKNSELIKASGLAGSELISFDDFDENIFSDKKQREDSVKLKNLLKGWCENFPKIKKSQIVILGETGVGKTFLMKCMAKSLAEKNVSVCYASAFEMNSILLKYHTTFDESKNSILVPFLESDVLFIDDLGTEPLLNNVTINYLFLILSERERFNRPVIITSNLDMENIKSRYGDRIYSRLSNKNIGSIFLISGDDIRTNNKR